MRRTGLRMRETGTSRKTPTEFPLLLFIWLINKYYISIPFTVHRPAITNEPSLATTSPSTRFLPGNPRRFCTNTSDRRCFKPSTKYKGRSPPATGIPRGGGRPREDGRTLDGRRSLRVVGARAHEGRLPRFGVYVGSYSGVL